MGLREAVDLGIKDGGSVAGAELKAARLGLRVAPCVRIDRVPCWFLTKSRMKSNIFLGKKPFAAYHFTQERTQSERAMGGSFTLDRNPDAIGEMPVLNERRKAFPQPAWSGKEVNDADG